MPSSAAGVGSEATPRPARAKGTVATTEPPTTKSTEPFAVPRDEIVITESKSALAPVPFAAGPPQRSVPAGAAACAAPERARATKTRATDAVPKRLRRDVISVLPCRGTR